MSGSEHHRPTIFGTKIGFEGYYNQTRGTKALDASIEDIKKNVKNL